MLSQARSRAGKRGREEGRGEYSKKCCVLCAGAALLPAEMRTTNFIHFFEIARVAPINRQVCAITGKPRPAACCWWVQKAKEVDEHLATCSRFTPDLHFGAAALQEAAAFNARDRNSLTRLGWVPALPGGWEFATHSSNEGALVASGSQSFTPASFPPCSPVPFSLAQLAVTFPLCFNRLLSVSLNAGKRVFYVPCKRAKGMEQWGEGGVPARCLAT